MVQWRTLKRVMGLRVLDGATSVGSQERPF